MTVIRAVAVATILALCFSTTANADQHRKEDRSIKELVERLGSDDAQIREPAAKALETRCTKADAGMGGLTGLSDDDDSAKLERFRKEAKPLISALVKLLESPYEESHVAAARALGAIGPDAAACRTALRKIIRDKNNSQGFRMVAVPALLSVTPAGESAGRDVIEGLVDAFFDNADDLEAPDEVIPGQSDEETLSGMYGSYFAGLLIITGRTSIEVPPLVEVTAAAFPRRLRLTAIAALATLEAEAASAVPSLRKLLGDVDHLVRQFAGLAIAHIEGDRSEIAPIIKAMSLDERESAKFVDEANDLVKQRQEASQRIRENGTENVQLAMPMLKHRNSYHQRQAIRMLAEIGPPARDAVPELKKLLKSDDKATRAAAAEALKAIEGASAPAASEPNKPKAE
jgi:HEAT repeat protein